MTTRRAFRGLAQGEATASAGSVATALQGLGVGLPPLRLPRLLAMLGAVAAHSGAPRTIGYEAFATHFNAFATEQRRLDDGKLCPPKSKAGRHNKRQQRQEWRAEPLRRSASLSAMRPPTRRASSPPQPTTQAARSISATDFVSVALHDQTSAEYSTHATGPAGPRGSRDAQRRLRRGLRGLWSVLSSQGAAVTGQS